MSERAEMSSVGSLTRDAARRLSASGSDTARLDAEVLLAHVLRVDRATLLAAPEATVGPEQEASFAALVERRAKGEPVAYLRGLKEFFGLAFTVDSRALIPRPETELLVGLALDRIVEMLTGKPRPAGTPPLVGWDVGTGSGAIAVAVAVESRNRGYAEDVRLIASDVSAAALSLAVENAVAHGVAHMIDFELGPLTELTQPSDSTRGQVADLLVANLPYIPSAVIPQLPTAASFEPRAALDGGADGLRLIEALLTQLPGVLAADGVALLEIGSDQESGVRRLAAERLPGWLLAIETDLGERPRVAELRRAAAA